jgi:predicted O-linked N-acetylglucosamine transferase (SPINDLY family)
VVDDDILAPYWKYEPSARSDEPHEWDGRRLKVGLVSSDFGVHPVATLLRGMIQFLNSSRIELFCFSLNDKLSWWGTNISMTAEHFVSLSNMNNQVPLAPPALSSLMNATGGCH